MLIPTKKAPQDEERQVNNRFENIYACIFYASIFFLREKCLNSSCKLWQNTISSYNATRLRVQSFSHQPQESQVINSKKKVTFITGIFHSRSVQWTVTNPRPCAPTHPNNSFFFACRLLGRFFFWHMVLTISHPGVVLTIFHPRVVLTVSHLRGVNRFSRGIINRFSPPRWL